jgi:Flp pilus assembly protein TadG
MNDNIHLSRRKSRTSKQRGAVLVLFSLALIGTLLSAGLAVDLGGAYVSRANLSKAVDAAALSGARYAGGSDAELKKQIENMALANFSGASAAKYTISVEHPGTDTTKVKVAGATKYDTVFARLAGIDQFDMQSAAEAIRYPLDMTLILDLSGSLQSNGVFDDMQKAATTFLDHFDEKVDQIGLVSYSTWAKEDVKAAKLTKSSIKSKINGFKAISDTNIDEGLRLGKINLDNAAARTNAIKVVVLFTDGRPTAFANTITMPSSHNPKTYNGIVAAYVSGSSYRGLFQITDGQKITKFNKGKPVLTTNSSSTASTPTPAKLPSGKSVNGANIRDEGITEAEYWANELRKKGYLIYSVGLGNPNAKSEEEKPDLDFLRRVANEKGIVSGSQPKGELMFAPTAAQLDAMFTKVADRILTRLTH